LSDRLIRQLYFTILRHSLFHRHTSLTTGRKAASTLFDGVFHL